MARARADCEHVYGRTKHAFFREMRRQLSQSGSAFSRDQSPKAAVSIFAVGDSSHDAFGRYQIRSFLLLANASTMLPVMLLQLEKVDQ